MIYAKRFSATATIGVVLTFVFAIGSLDRGSLGHPDDKDRSDVGLVRVAENGKSGPSKAASRISQGDSVVRLTGRDTEDDYPALAVGPSGSVWLAYVEYRRGQPIVAEQVQNRIR